MKVHGAKGNWQALPEYEFLAARNYWLVTPKYRDFAILDSAPSDRDRHGDFRCAIFTGSGIKELFAVDDPEEYQLWNKVLTTEDWSLMSYAFNLQNVTMIGGLELFQYDIGASIKVEPKSPESFSLWINDFSLLVENICSTVRLIPLSYSLVEGEEETIACTAYLRAQGIATWLYEADRIVRHVERYEQLTGVKLAQEELRQYLKYKKDRAEVVFKVFQGLRPAADLWRKLPWELLGRYEQLRGARAQLNRVDKGLIADLTRQIWDRAYLLDDNAGKKAPIVRKWWEWADDGYCVNSIFHSFTSASTAQLHLKRVSRACEAFDPKNPANVEALTILNEPGNRPDRRGSPIIENLAATHANLCKMREYLREVIAASKEVVPGHAMRKPSWVV